MKTPRVLLFALLNPLWIMNAHAALEYRVADIYAAHQDNILPLLAIAQDDITQSSEWSEAQIGQAWTGQLQAFDEDGSHFYWQLLNAPKGMTLTAQQDVTSESIGYSQNATLSWTPNNKALTDTEIVVRVWDSRGSSVVQSFNVSVSDGNHAPIIKNIYAQTLTEGQLFTLPLVVSDAKGDALTISVSSLPAGAVFDAQTGVLSWRPDFNQAGEYKDIRITVSDGKTMVSKTFDLTVEQAYPRPIFATALEQTLLEGETVALQLQARLPSGIANDANTTVTWQYVAPWLPGGATLNRETGWLSWQASYNQHGEYRVPVTAIAIFTSLGQEPITMSVSQEVVFNVLNANGTPQFINNDGQAWQILEGQPLRISVMAIDPDNPDFEPRIRVSPNTIATGPETTDPTVSYQITGLPTGASFDSETLEIIWTPTYTQSGTYYVNVIATDDGDGTGVPAISSMTIPIVVNNANRTPEIGDISNVILDKGRVFEIPVSISDVDGNPIQVSVNQTPRILPMPLQLIQEGETLAFSVLGVDADQQVTRVSLLRDANTPEGVFFDASSGYFEWTPNLDTVNNALMAQKTVDFNFLVSDGVATSTRRVQVRVLDTNRAPTLNVNAHALVVGQSFSLAVQRGGVASNRTLNINDADGEQQTQALSLLFKGLPEGAVYDTQSQRLIWTPNPAQVGDYTIQVQVSDGTHVTTQVLSLRVFADVQANAPHIALVATPSSPVVPQQNVMLTVHADAWSPIATINAQVKGQGLGLTDWQTIIVDNSGRINLKPTQAGLIEIRVKATDIDGFSAEQQHIVRVKEPTDNSAPLLAWQGVLLGASAATLPALINQNVSLSALVQDQQLMGYELAISSTVHPQWQVLQHQDNLAIAVNNTLSLANIDPTQWANGLYQVRLTAWDVSGKTTEIMAQVVIESSQKLPAQAQVTDAVYQLGTHELALNRVLNTQSGDVGNWQFDLFNSQLSSNQPALSATGAALAWQEGAKVWIQVPASLTQANAGIQALSFSLNTQSEQFGGVGAPQVWHPVFTSNQGWNLAAYSDDELVSESLTKLGDRLFDSLTGLPWQPSYFVLTAPDGTQYHLNDTGKITRVEFSDGAQWLVSDAGIAAIGSEQRLDFVRDSQGRISRVLGVKAGENEASTTLYSYNLQQQLIQVRTLGTANTGLAYGYQVNGQLIEANLQANLGTATNWYQSANSPQWQGQLIANTPTEIGFSIRESELASTVKVAGAQGAVLVAISLNAEAQTQIELLGGTVLAQTTLNGQRTLLVRFTQSGLKVLRLQGTGTASIRLAVVGDINQDGTINGLDSQLFKQQAVDVNGDGQADTLDEQLLFANYGWQANRAPVVDTLPNVKTHTDLQTAVDLQQVAKDAEGDAVYWRVVSASHGQAVFSSDGTRLLFTPEQGFSGQASITVQADDGYNLSAPITLNVNVSGAKLLAIHVQDLGALVQGQQVKIKASLDFEDEKGVALIQGNYLTLSQIDLDTGIEAIQIDDAKDTVYAKEVGAILLELTRINSDGSAIKTYRTANIVSAIVDEYGGVSYNNPQQMMVLDFYPNTLALTVNATRQLKVHLKDYQTGQYSDIHLPSQMVFAGTPETLDTYEDPETGEIFTDVIPATLPIYSRTVYKVANTSLASVTEDGFISALANGKTTLSVIHLAKHADPYGNIQETVISQYDIALTIEQAQELVPNSPQSKIIVSAQEGAVIQASTGEQLLIGAGALIQDTPVAITAIDVSQIENIAGIALPATGQLKIASAFELELGQQATKVPVQLAIPVTDPSIQAGDEVFFFRRGTFIDGQGQTQETWWLVDNGFVGNDGVAKTASPPFNGVSDTGIYAMMVKKGTQAGELIISLAKNTYANFTVDNFSIAGATTLKGENVQIAVTGIIAATAQVVNTVRYFLGVPTQIGQLIDPNKNTQVSLGENLPPAATPNGVAKPVNISAASYDATTKKVVLKVSNDDPGTFVGTLAVRMRFIDGSYQDIVSVAGNTNGNIEFSVPPHIALGTVNWQIVRLVPTTNVSPSGVVTQGTPLEFTGNLTNLSPPHDIMAALTRTSVSFLRDNKEIGRTDLTYDDEGAHQLSSYMYGTKIQPMVISTEGARAYIAGSENLIYVIDLITFELYETIHIPAGQNIASLAVAGQVLIIGEGRAYSTESNYRLLALDIYPTKNSQLNTPVMLQAQNFPSAPNGFAGMTVGSDGVTLVVAAPQKSTSWSNVGTSSPKGDVLIFNLSTLNLSTGQIKTPVIAQLPSDGISLKGPRLISATNDPDHYLVSSPNDYARGLSTLVLTRDENSLVVSGALTALNMEQPANKVKFDRLNILRADGAVLVERDGVEYALVADNNHPYNDPYFQAMFETPLFAQLSPVGPPTAVGGSASAKPVNVGGKIGIIRDPFGKLAAPVYLGATIPFHGYGFTNLSLGVNSQLIVQLISIPTILDGQAEKPHKTCVWDADKLIQAALEQPESEHLMKPIKPQDVNGSNSFLCEFK